MSHADECGHCKDIEAQRIAAAERELAVKVLAAIDDTWRWPDARLAVVDLFAAEGINLAPLTARREKEGEGLSGIQ